MPVRLLDIDAQVWAPATSTNPDDFRKPRATLSLGIVAVDSGGGNNADQLELSLNGDGVTGTASLLLLDPVALPPDPARLEQPMELRIRLTGFSVGNEAAQAAAERLARAGLLGLDFSTGAELESMVIVLRPPSPEGSWSMSAPFFELRATWVLTGAAAGSQLYTGADGSTLTAGASASASIRVTAGLACVEPKITAAESLLVRLDLDSAGLTTDWLPLSLVDFGGLASLHLNGLARWFADIVAATDVNGVFNDVDLPDWNLDLPLITNLPFGIEARSVSCAIRKRGGAYRLTFAASNFWLTWGETELPLGDLEIVLALAEAADGSLSYRLSIRLYEALHPETSTQDETFDMGLPFGLLKLTAACARFRIGLFSSGSAEDPGRLCVQAGLEIGGLRIASSLSEDAPLFEGSVRLVTRNFRVVQQKNDVPDLFDNLPADSRPVFNDYAGAAPALTFAEDLRAPAGGPKNDYGVQILDGDVKKGERFYLAWTQQGAQPIFALLNDLGLRPPAGPATDPNTLLSLGLELAWFGPSGARDLQMRLDWSDGKVAELLQGSTQTLSQWTPYPDESDPVGHRLVPEACQAIPLPPEAMGVLIESPPNAYALDIPGVRLEIAEPRAHSIVLSGAGEEASLSYLHIYDRGPGTGDTAPLVARAQIGVTFSDPDGARETVQDGRDKVECAQIGAMSGDPDGAGETVEDTRDMPLLDIGVGYGGNAPTAVRVLGWRKGGGVRFFDTYSTHAPAIPSLLQPSAASTGAEAGCPEPLPPRPPALPLRWDAFGTPEFAEDGWQLAFRFAALDKALDLFGSDGGNKVRLDIVSVRKPIRDRHLLIDVALTVMIGLEGSTPFQAKGEMTFRFDPSDLSLSIEEEAKLSVALEFAAEGPAWALRLPLPPVPKGMKRRWAVWPGENRLLGLEFMLFADLPDEEAGVLAKVDFLNVSFGDGRVQLELTSGREMVLRYDDLGRDNLAFRVETFRIGPGGVDLNARLLTSTLSVKGLKKPFVLEEAVLAIENSRLEMLSVSASGALPEILDEAPVELTITFEQNRPGGDIVLRDLICILGDEDEPIFSRGTRFKFEISVIELRYVGTPEAGEKHFFFELSGSAQFSPSRGEFAGGLLAELESVRVDFIRAPLTEEFTDHLSFNVKLTEPKVFPVFSLFEMEIRSIGFHPNFADFADPGPAIIIGGQCKFAKIGDVISAEIDFHSLYIGLPKRGEVIPQIHFDGLRVNISTDGFRIAGSVRRYESDLIKGFAGEGMVGIPGFPELSAAFSFVRLRERPTDPWKHAWFIAIEAAKISYQIPPLPIYLRQVGLGFGFRYTLPLIKEFEQQSTLREMIERMLSALNRHQTLARIDSWVPDPDRKGQSALWTIALEAVFTLGTSQPTPFDYQAEKERKLKTLVAQIIAAFRSDFTLVAAAKIWYPVSVDDFFSDKSGMRNRPLASGFMIYSAPQKRFLAHAAKGKNPYIGEPNDPWPPEVQQILNNSHFEATLLIEPSLVHAELGWPDRLMFRFSLGPLQVECRAGVLLRIESDTIVQGIYLSARGSVSLSGGVSLGFVGVRVSAHVELFFATRLMTALYLSRPLASKLYAEIGIEIAVRFSVQAWLRIKVGFVKISIDISFSFSIQIALGLELGWNGIGSIGFRGRATVLIGVFGRSLRAGVAVGLNEGAVVGARAALLPYMASFLEPGQPPRVPDGNLLAEQTSGGPGAASTRAAPRATVATDAPMTARTSNTAITAVDARRLDSDRNTETENQASDGFVTSHVIGRDGRTYVWIMPGPASSLFYPVPKTRGSDGWTQIATVTPPGGAHIHTYGPDGFRQRDTLFARYGKSIRVDDVAAENTQDLTLLTMLAGCYGLAREADIEAWEAAAAANGEVFPENWAKGGYAPMLEVPKSTTPMESVADDRVLDLQSPDRSPRRALDDTSRYDRLLKRAMSEEDLVDLPARAQLMAQALGNQSFLLQSFYDDLVAIAAGRLSEVEANESRPTILDLGMLVRVDGPPPDWALSRGGSGLTFAFSDHDNLEPAVPSQITAKPVIDFQKVDFAAYPPVFNEATSYFDEELIGLHWRLGWGGVTPEVAFGASNEAEDYVRAYDLQVVDSQQRLLKRQTIKPCDLVVSDEDGNGLLRVRTRYRVTLPVRDLLPEEALSGQRLLNINVTVTPIDQIGRAGGSYTFTPSFKPSLTPLPADDGRLQLSTRPDPQANGIRAVEARIRWRQLSLPNRPGIARTDRWHLVLRPLREVPMGAYPAEAAEAEDRGLMSVTGQALIEGDIVVVMDGLEEMIEAAFRAEDDPARDPADKGYEIVIGPEGVTAGRAGSVSPWPTQWQIRDHLGSLIPDDAAQDAAKSFFTQIGASKPKGRAWRLFLRAESRYPGGESLSTLSGLTQLRLSAVLPAEKDAPSRSGDKGLRTDPVERPLPHFEWPIPQIAAEDLVARPRAAGGLVLVPVMTGDGKLFYVEEPSRRRSVSLEWSALPEDGRTSYEAVAEYRVHMTGTDALLNADLAPGTGFTAPWERMARVFPADRRGAADTPDNTADAEKWISHTPAFSATQAWFDRRGIDRRDQARQRPGWYDWSASTLVWPDPMAKTEEALNAISAAAGRSPLEVLARPHGGGKTETLAAWADLGRQAAGARVHPLLGLVVGYIAAMREAGTFGFADGSLRPAKHIVEVSTGPGVSERDAATWLAANTAETDPIGRSALGHLGLGLTLVLRDPLTGLRRAQDEILEETQNALTIVISTLRDAAASNPALVGAGNTAEILHRKHLSWDHPIQTVWSERAEGAGSKRASLSDAALSMLHVSLRPLPKMHGRLYYVTLGIDARASADTNWRISLIWLNRGLAPKTLAPDQDDNLGASVELKAGDTLLVRFLPKPGEAPAEPEWWLCLKGDPAWMHMAEPRVDGDRRTVVPLDRPLPLDPENTQVRSPFGAFPVDAEYWGTALDKGPGAAFGYLGRAFGVQFPNPADPREKKPREVEKSLGDTPGIAHTVIAWSHRFFASAPLPAAGLSHQQGIEVARASTVSAPKVVDPIRIAADSAGIMRISLTVIEPWASTRSFAVTAIDRYARLRAAMDAEPDQILDGTPSVELRARMLAPPARADASLPRIQALEPPQILAQRRIRGQVGQTDQWFNELIVARHAEAALSEANIQAARKLDFGVIARFHERSFRFDGWLNALRNAGWLDGIDPRLPEDMGLPEGRDRVVTSEAARLTLLAEAPAARWGAEALITLSDPFFYATRVELVATAADEISPAKIVSFVPALPGTPVPQSLQPGEVGEEPAFNTAPLIEVKPPTWSDLDEQVAARHERWASLTSEDLRPQAKRLLIRLPRLAESLSADSLHPATGCHRAEALQRGAIGLLPDPEVSLQLIEKVEGSSNVIARISPNRSAPREGGSPLYTGEVLDSALGPLSNDDEYKALERVASGAAWDGGLVLGPILRRVAQQVPRPDAVPGDIAPPEMLVDGRADPLPRDAMPRDGAFARLLPLALRLIADPGGALRFAEPGIWPRADVSLRPPASVLDGRAPASIADLAIGIRLVLDWHRRNAAAHVAWDLAEDVEGPLPEMLGRIEASDLVHLSPPCDRFVLDRTEPPAGIRVWVKEPNGDTPVWVEAKPQDGLPAAPGSRVLIVSDATTAPRFIQYAQRAGINDVGAPPAVPYPPIPSDIAAVSAWAQEIAVAAHRARPIPTPEVYVQRGNAPRALWAKLDKGS